MKIIISLRPDLLIKLEVCDLSSLVDLDRLVLLLSCIKEPRPSQHFLSFILAFHHNEMVNSVHSTAAKPYVIFPLTSVSPWRFFSLSVTVYHQRLRYRHSFLFSVNLTLSFDLHRSSSIALSPVHPSFPFLSINSIPGLARLLGFGFHIRVVH